jgi:histidine ammonia-lyase
MAAWAALKLLRICDNVELILAIEALAAARAIDAQAPLTTTPELAPVHACIRTHVPYDPTDHRLDREIETIAGMIRRGELGALLPERARTAVI